MAEARLKRLNKVYIDGFIEYDDYREQQKEISTKIEEATEELEKVRQALRRPTEVKTAVDRATKLVVEQIESLRSMGQILEVMEYMGLIDPLEPHEDPRNIFWSALWTEKGRQINGDLKEVVDELRRYGSSITKEDLSRQGIRKLIFQQMRGVIQDFHDPDRDVEVWDKHQVEFHISIPKGEGEEGRKIIKSS